MMAFYGIKYHIRPLTYNTHRIPIVKKKPDRHVLIKLSIGEYNSYSVYPERTSQLGNLVDHIIIVFHHRLYLNIFVLFYCDFDLRDCRPGGLQEEDSPEALTIQPKTAFDSNERATFLLANPFAEFRVVNQACVMTYFGVLMI